MGYSKIEGMSWRLKTFIHKRWMAFQDRFGLYRYADWIRENEPKPEELEKQKRQSLDFTQRPLISCLLAFSNPDYNDIIQTLTSLSDQTYDNWEAYCFVPTGEGDACLRRISQNDHRIHLLEGNFEEDFFIIGNAFTAKSFQKMLGDNGYSLGEYIFVLQVGDTVSPGLLFRVVERLNQKPEIDLFYTDEDHLMQNSHTRYAPFFKPDWSPELLCSINYLKFSLVRTSYLHSVCVNSEPETQYEDLILRCAEDTPRISHLPDVLIHYGDKKEIEDRDEGSNRYSLFIKRRFDKMGIHGVQMDITRYGTPHLTWSIPQPLVSIIIPTKNHLPDLQCAIESIRKLTAYSHYELVLVDNESSDPATLKYYEQIEQSPDVRIVKYDGNFNFSAALNLGAGAAQGDIFLFLNNDIQIIDPEWLTELARWALIPDVGIVGAKLLYPNGKIQHAGIVIGMEGHANHVFAYYPEGATGIFGSVEWYRNYSALTGACIAMRRRIFEEVGGFNAEYQIAFSDIDICQQVIRHGYRVVYNPFARLIHHEGRTRSRLIPRMDIETGYNRLREVIKYGDPHYNPNLSYAVRYPTYRRQNEESMEERLNRVVSL